MKRPKISTLRNKLDTVFSRFIRLRDADHRGMVTCCTCSKPMHWKDAQCGHFQVRTYYKTRWDELNCHPQCPQCNMNDGEQFKHAQYIDRRYGGDTAEYLYQQARSGPLKLTHSEYMELIKIYSDKVKSYLD